MTRKLERKHKKEEEDYYEEPTGILDEGDFGESLDRPEESNPFKELENLITSKDIDVKTYLTDRQVVVMHKLATLHGLYTDEGEHESAKMIKNYARTFMTLIINKNGLSRTQYIEAIGKGRERAEESRREKMNAVMGNML